MRQFSAKYFERAHKQNVELGRIATKYEKLAKGKSFAMM